MRVHIVANLTARGLLRSPARLDALRASAAGRAQLFETSSVAELARVMRLVLDDGVDLCVLAGGDGTFMSGVSAMAAALDERGDHADGRRRGWPRLGLLPMGTVGTIARNLGERGEPEDLLERWLAAPNDVHAIPRPTLALAATQASGGVEEKVGFIVGTGLVARFFEVYEERGAGGIPLAGRIVARVFAESFSGGPLAKRILTPLPCELLVDGERQASSALSLLCASVVRDLGLGMKVCYRAGEEPDRVHLVASQLSPRHLGPRAPFVMAGRSIGGPGHVDRLVSSFEVIFPGEQGPYVLDGDMFRAKSFRVTAGPIIPVVGPRDR
jgi:diacylglycerol kinase (ATP)